MEKSKANEAQSVRNAVRHRLYMLKAKDSSRARADLARLRRGVGKSFDQAPEAWQIVFDSFAEDKLGKNSSTSPGENAAFVALTLYAMAMVGKDTSGGSLDQQGVDLGTAAAQFTIKTVGTDEKGKSQILPRMKRLMKADSVEEAAVPLRSILQLFADQEIQLDFADLASDLYFYSTLKERSFVRLKWSRSYFRQIDDEKRKRQKPEKKEQEQLKQNRKSKAAEVKEAVRQELNVLKAKDYSQARADLARLRRGAGKSFDQAPEAWQIVLDILPEDRLGKSSYISPGETAAFITLTLYATAMVEKDTYRGTLDQPGVDLGAAAARFTIKTIGTDEKGKSQILPRMKRLMNADSVEEAAVPLRSILRLFADQEIPLDFADLAYDLYFYSILKGRSFVRLKWARSYFRQIDDEKRKRQKSKKEGQA